MTSNVKYDRQVNVKQLDIDSLPLRSKVPVKYLYHNVNSINRKQKHLHGFDAYDNSKLLSSMNSRKCKEAVNLAAIRYQMIDTTTNQVLYTLKAKECSIKVKKLIDKGYKISIKTLVK